MNSIIFKNPQEQHLFDLSNFGIRFHENKVIQIEQPSHYFQVGDVLFYDIKTQKFVKALAKNNIDSEVCGVVSEVISADEFIIITEGEIQTDRYTFDVDTVLYLSEVQPGKLISIQPSSIVKQIAIQTNNGIMVKISRGLKVSVTEDTPDVYEPYTTEELNEIIQNIW